MGETVEVWDCLSGPTHVASKENVWSTRGAKQATIQEDQYRHLVHRSRLCGHFSSADQHSSSPEDALFKLSRLFFLLSVFPVVFYRLNWRGYLGYLFSWSPRVWGIQIQRRYGFDLNCRIGRACDISQHSKKLLNFYWLQPFFLLFSGGGDLWKGIGDCLKTRIASKPGSSWQTIPTVACLVI